MAPVDLLAWERRLRRAGYDTIVGVDEVGRGALAGPIVAAAVVLPQDLDPSANVWRDVRDSKSLTAKRRTALADGITSLAAHCAVAAVQAPVIDAVGIGPANRLVLEHAVRNIERYCSVDFLLLDAFTIEHGAPQSGIVGGDARSLSIAAASIVAKVYRDTIMTELSGIWTAYEWDCNKGYGVARHLAALRECGPSVHHRFSFRPVRLAGPMNRV
jgi:ribonuclease HII